jgi:hypothetical protein
VVVSREDLNKAVADARLDVGTGLAATTASLVMGAGPVPATIIGGTGPALKLAYRVLSRARERREGRVARTMEHAAEILDVGLDIFEERATAYDDRLELLARVLEAAARTPLEAKVTALARVLAEGLREGGSTDEAIIFAAALENIEAAHVFLLHHLAIHPLPPNELRGKSEETQRGWDRAQLSEVIPELVPILDGLLAVLTGQGLIRTQADSTWAGVAAMAQYAITPLGRRCLLLLGEEIPEPNAA